MVDGALALTAGTLSSITALGSQALSEWDALSTLWILIAAFLVFFMQAGFGMLETGLVRTKNAANVLTKNVLDFCFAAMGYLIFGYAIMYGGDGTLFDTHGLLLI